MPLPSKNVRRQSAPRPIRKGEPCSPACPRLRGDTCRPAKFVNAPCSLAQQLSISSSPLPSGRPKSRKFPPPARHQSSLDHRKECRRSAGLRNHDDSFKALSAVRAAKTDRLLRRQFSPSAWMPRNLRFVEKLATKSETRTHVGRHHRRRRSYSARGPRRGRRPRLRLAHHPLRTTGTLLPPLLPNRRHLCHQNETLPPTFPRGRPKFKLSSSTCMQEGDIQIKEGYPPSASLLRTCFWVFTRQGARGTTTSRAAKKSFNHPSKAASRSEYSSPSLSPPASVRGRITKPKHSRTVPLSGHTSPGEPGVGRDSGKKKTKIENASHSIYHPPGRRGIAFPRPARTSR